MSELLREYGKRKEKTIVMIHGTAMSYGMLEDVAERLSETYRVILVNVPGHDPEGNEERTDEAWLS